MGVVKFPRLSVRINGSQPPIGMPPRLGEHTQALLREAGWDDARIAALQSKDC